MRIEVGECSTDVRADCKVTVEESGAQRIKIVSTVQSLYGEQTHKLICGLILQAGDPAIEIFVEDRGALPFTLSARVEAALRSLGYCLPRKNKTREFPKSARVTRLYIPGNSAKYFPHAGLYGSDAIIFDLEDSVPESQKYAARILVRNALEEIDFGGAEIMIRVNAGSRAIDDVLEFQGFNGLTFLIPKCESSDDVSRVANACVDMQNVSLIPIIESAKGLMNVAEILTADNRIDGATLGLEDYTASIGATRTASGEEVVFAMGALINTARALDVCPLGSVHAAIDDEVGLREFAHRMKRLGFEGIGCLHPKQIKIVDEVFSPTSIEIEDALRIVKSVSDATAVAVVDGRMVDAPVVKRARRVLDKAGIIWQ